MVKCARFRVWLLGSKLSVLSCNQVANFSSSCVSSVIPPCSDKELLVSVMHCRVCPLNRSVRAFLTQVNSSRLAWVVFCFKMSSAVTDRDETVCPGAICKRPAQDNIARMPRTVLLHFLWAQARIKNKMRPRCATYVRTPAFLRPLLGNNYKIVAPARGRIKMCVPPFCPPIPFKPGSVVRDITCLKVLSTWF